MSHNLDLTTHAIEQHGRLVFGVIWRLLPDRDEAMDLYQETFLRYHTVVQRGKTIEYPKAWLCRVATNEAFKRLRQRGRQTSLTDGSGHDQPARSNPEEEIEQFMSKLRDPLGTLYRFTLPKSLLKRVVKESKEQQGE